MSHAKWPSKQYENDAAAAYGYEDVPSGDPGLSENLLQVNVYFKSLNVRTVEEDIVYESFDDPNFVSAFGGALGLFLGISLVSAIEIFEFVLDLIINLCIFCGRSKKKKPPSSGDKDKIQPWTEGFEYKEPFE